MKKLLILAGAVCALALSACSGSVKADLKDNVDTLTYELGVAQSYGLKGYMQMQLHVDTAYIDEFIRGMKQGALNEPDPKQNAYQKGLEIGQQVAQMAQGLSNDVYAGDSTKSINTENLLAGIIDGLLGNTTETADEAYEKFQELIAPIHTANLLAEFGDNKEAGEAYLAENAKKEGVTVLPSGVQFSVIEAGAGDVPTDTTIVEVRYEGKLVDGTVFDSNTDENRNPLKINMARPGVVPGFLEAVQAMPLGAKWEVTIPQELAYGEQNSGSIKPFSTLIFTIERVK